jgi:hypothetical protein
MVSRFKKVADEIYESGYQYRWRKEELDILKGEAKNILRRNSVEGYATNVAAVAYGMKLWATDPDSFSNTAEEAAEYRANIGSLLYQRVSGLSSPTGVASNYFKIWKMSDAVRYASYDLPKLLRVKTSKISLAQTLEILADWDRGKLRILSVISEEFHNNNNRKEQ